MPPEQFNNQKNSIEQEKEPKFIGRITLLRHGQTEYTDIYPDVTEEGKETVRKSAEQIAANLKEDEEVFLMASDKVRAQGTAGIIKEVLKTDKKIRTVPGITSMAMRDKQKGNEMIQELIAEGGVPAVDYAYTHDPRFDDAKIWEPRDEIQKRFFSNLEYAIRAFKVVAKHKELPKPHFVGVTHFEVLNPFLDEIFDLKHPEEPTLKNAEVMEISIQDPSAENENSDIVFFKITFREKTKTVGFDRKNRRLVSIE
ncbi:MAG: histidine phosphatase family protein [Candidatus Paceibacterota bacterium]|jgi:broad specificity phosphatase PhoE